MKRFLLAVLILFSFSAFSQNTYDFEKVTGGATVSINGYSHGYNLPTVTVSSSTLIVSININNNQFIRLVRTADAITINGTLMVAQTSAQIANLLTTTVFNAGSATPGIDDVLAVGQNFSTARTIPMNGQSLTITGTSGAALFLLANTGQLRLHKYGIGTFTGTATRTLEVTSTGLLMEGPLVASAAYTATITAGSNTGSPVFSSGYYMLIGSICHFRVTGHINTLASGTANFTISLPFQSNASAANATGTGLITQNLVNVGIQSTINNSAFVTTCNIVSPQAETEYFSVDGTYTL